jgi:dinuclear metal center YbgI/SA1388 family protein
MFDSLSEIVRFADKNLNTAGIKDYSGAKNGLQLENDGQVTRIGAAVDSHIGVVEEAINRGIDLLVVHHGLFWGEVTPFTGTNYRKIQLAIVHNLAIYSAHLPLDLHPKIGNNALLAKALGFKSGKPFFFDKEQYLGGKFEVRTDRDSLTKKLTELLGVKPVVLPHGPEKIRKVGIVSGGAGGELARAVAEGVDTFITGEGPNHTFGQARELGINVFYGGHYATETFGVKALANLLSERFQLPWQFIDIPTGL